MRNRNYTVFKLTLTQGVLTWVTGELIPNHIDMAHDWAESLRSPLGRVRLLSPSYEWKVWERLPAELISTNVVLLNGELRWIEQNRFAIYQTEDHSGFPINKRMQRTFAADPYSLTEFLKLWLRSPECLETDLEIIAPIWTGDGDPIEYDDLERENSKWGL